MSLESLEIRHRIEEVGERFGLVIDTTSEGGLLAFTRLAHLRIDGRPLSAAAARARAEATGLTCTDLGIAFRWVGSAEPVEEALLRFLSSLYEADPEPFLELPPRGLAIPPSGALPQSTAWLERFYGGDFLPREKKPPVVDLRRSQGPFLRSVDESPLQIIDSASQIASLPGGFRADAVQAALDEGRFDEHLVASLDTRDTTQPWRERYADALRALVPPALCHVSFVSSGAEANEKALHIARKNGPGGRRVIAFEGAFHGRTLLALFATHNPAKRAAYQLPGYETTFIPFPVAEDPFADPPVPTGWRETWTNPEASREPLIGDEGDPWLASEVASLCALEAEIKQGNVLAVMIEPYQCEGGDRSATLRFFHGLRALTRGHGVPLIFDEVQSGFGLSGPFFWHRRFWMIDQHGRPDCPDLIVCAKRAQVGVVLSRWPDETPSLSHSAGLVRGRVHLDIIQGAPDHSEVVQKKLDDLAVRWPPGLVTRQRAFGDAFAFDLPSKAIAEHLINQRFYRGYMLYIAGERTLRYRLNRSMRASDIDLVFTIIERSIAALVEQAGGLGDGLFERMAECKAPAWVALGAMPSSPRAPDLTLLLADPRAETADRYLKAHGELALRDRQAGAAWLGLTAPRGSSALKTLRAADAAAFEAAVGVPLVHFAADVLGTRVRRITIAELDDLHETVVELEYASYEAARRDPLAYLRIVAKSEHGIFLLAEDPDGAVGMSFAAPLELWWGVDGPRQDPHFGRNNTLYSADITVAHRARGRGIGQRLRARQNREALAARRKDGLPRFAFITGRNRLGEADQMWEINRRLGAYTAAVYHGQYGEDGARARYYRLPLRRHDRRTFATTSGPDAVLDVAMGIATPTGPAHPTLVRARDLGVFDEAACTKLTVSNFITRPYARYAEALRELAPRGCRHMYFTSSLDEMVDKTCRALKHRRKEGRLAVGLWGGYLGHTTAAARSLTDFGAGGQKDRYFDWPLVPHPTLDPKGCAEMLERIAARPDEVLGVFVEAVQARTGTPLTQDAWALLCAFRDRTGIPLVLSETTTGRWRSGRGAWWLDGAEGDADLVLWWGGGQIGHIFTGERAWVETPVTLISTWDGDELSATRSLWQLYACRTADVPARAGQLEAGLREAGFDRVDGMGLYRVIRTNPMMAHVIVGGLARRGIRIGQLGDDRLLVCPPMTVTEDEIERLCRALKVIVSEHS